MIYYAIRFVARPYQVAEFPVAGLWTLEAGRILLLSGGGGAANKIEIATVQTCETAEVASAANSNSVTLGRSGIFGTSRARECGS